MPAAQHISADDFASLLKVPLLKADRNCTLMLCEQTAAQALEAEHIYELLDSLLQHRVVDSTHNPWLPGADVLLGLPGAQELSAGQIKDLLQHVSFGLLDSEVQRQLLLLPDAELLDVHALWPSLELAVARCDVGVTSVLSDLLEPHGDFLLLLNTAGLAEKALQQHEPVAEPLLDLLHMVEPEQEDDEYVPAQQVMRLLRTAAHRRHVHALQSLCRLLGCKAVDPHQLAQLLQEVLHSRNYEAAKVLLRDLPALQHLTPDDAEQLLLLAIEVVGGLADDCKWEPDGMAAHIARDIALLLGVRQLGADRLKLALQAAIQRQASSVCWQVAVLVDSYANQLLVQRLSRLPAAKQLSRGVVDGLLVAAAAPEMMQVLLPLSTYHMV
ncbi:hypothetical protein OEZ85_010803 [Tetradesmus obliquus]|uniref:Uncharacterized protein n=1 Tax=Tetradesmus obliquus TaxID=3088 RepID=A0ABY8TS83_TETOB|nr:hypothetical protein OEZ85_010803 [Tetradesmus obliquus]